MRLDRNKIAGLGLTAVPPDAYADILVGKLNIRVAPLFRGKELRASIFETPVARTNIITLHSPACERGWGGPRRENEPLWYAYSLWSPS